MDKVFRKRFFSCFDEMKTLYSELYDDEECFNEFCERLEKYYEKRPESLKNLDLKREKYPNRYLDKVLSGIELHMENDVKTLRDVQGVLGFYNKNGVNVLDLGYVLSNSKKNNNPGAITDYRKLQSEYGKIGELLLLSASCHRKNMKVCIDVNISFTADNHKWAKKLMADDPVYMSRYILVENGDEANAYDERIEGEFKYKKDGAFTYLPEKDKYVMSTNNTHSWDINYKNPMVLNKMIRNLLFLANNGVDVFRIRDDKYVWKDLESGAVNPDKSEKIMRLYRLAFEIVCPGVLLWTDSSYNGHIISDRSVVDIIWHTLATQNCKLLKAHMDRMCEQPKEIIFSNSPLGVEPIKWELDYGLLAEEAINEKDHKRFLSEYYGGCYDSVADMSGIIKAINASDSDALDIAKKKYMLISAFMIFKCGMPVICERDENMIPEVHEVLCKLERFRQELKVFNTFADRWTMDTWDAGTLALGRYYDGQKLIAVFNFSDTDRTAWINENDGDYYELSTGDVLKAEGVEVNAYSFRLLKKDF